MRSLLPSLAALALAAGCDVSPTSAESSGDEAITTNAGTVLDFRFHAEVVADKHATARVAVVTQLQYVQGLLTHAVGGNAQVGLVTLAEVNEHIDGERKTISYSASLPVAWPKTGPTVPTTYDLVLPRAVTALAAFNAKYDGKCGSNEYGKETFWHDFDTTAQGCSFDDADVVRAEVKVAPHGKSTKNKYPEYREIWKDDRLEVVALYGIVASGGDTDPGHVESERLLSDVARMVRSPKVERSQAAGSILRDSTLTGKVTIGGRDRSVTLTAMVVRDLHTVGPEFGARYDSLSATADIIFYGGHSELGKNIDAFSSLGLVAKGKYQLAVLNGCQTFAYLGTTMNDRRIRANGAGVDPFGTKFLDVFANALPSFASTNTPQLESFVRAALEADRPRSYNDLLEETSADQLGVVFGEDDNTFSP